MFTYQYHQPDEYHFSLDSIHLAEFVATRIQNQNDLNTLRVLDLCSGCGVIGMELSWYVKELTQIDFIEVQTIYNDSFLKNVKTVNRPELKMRWHLLNYDVLLEKPWENQYDLIVSNPPYFLATHSMLSKSEFKNRCRFYLDSTFENFILAISNSLAVNGEAYFLLRSLKQHGCDVFSEAKNYVNCKSISLEKITTIRNTDVVLMKKFNQK